MNAEEEPRSEEIEKSRYRATLASIGDGVISTDAQGYVTFMNPVAERLTGWNEAAALAKPLDEIFRAVDEGTSAIVESAVKRILLNGRVVERTNHTLLVSKDGTRLPIASNGAPICDANGVTTGVVLVFRDQTADRQTRAAIVASETRYRRLFEAAQDGILILDAETGKIVDANPFLMELTGYSHDDFLGRHLWEIGPFRDEAASKLSFAELQTKKYVRYEDLPLRTRDGRKIQVEFVSNVYRVDDQDVIQCNIRDITDRKKTEHALQASETRYRRLFEAAQDGILILDAETGKIVDVNPFLMELTGYSHDDFLGKHLWEIGPFKDTAASMGSFAELQIKEYVRYEDLPLETADGRRIDVEFVSNVYRVDDQNVIQCNVRDITARKRSRDRDQFSRDLLDLLNHRGTGSNQIHGIVQLVKERTGIESVGIRLKEGDDFSSQLCAKGNPKLLFFTDGGTFWSNHATELLASTPEEDLQARTRNWCNSEGYESVALIPLRNRDEVIGLLQLSDHRRDRLDAEMVKYFEGLGASIGVALARERAEREIEESKQLVDSIVENVPLMVFLKEAQDLRFVVLNRAGEELLGYDRKDLLGKNSLDIFTPEQAAHSMARDREVLAADVLVDIPEEPILTAKKGTRLLHTRKVCIKGADGATKYLLGISDDITESKLAETRRVQLEEQLRVSQKMEAIGSLAGGVAHDFNNLLSVILSYTGFATEALREDHPLKNDLLEVKKAADRAVALTRQLLAFGRKQVLQPVPLCLNQIALGVEKMLRRILGEDIDFVQVLAPDLGLSVVDPGQIEQVLMNLVVNARDAMPQGGELTIETSNVEIDEEYAARHVAVTPGSYVQLAITDTGCGMDEQTRARLFEPFFTTKEKGRGTGLGLSTVYGIVKQSGGNIWVYTELGKGTTFKIYLPRDLAATRSSPSEPPTAPQRVTGTETILVVEDEEALRKVAKRALEAAGYTVLVAAGGDEALLTCAQHVGDIHLLLTDVVMPHVSGKALADRLATVRPGTKVLFMSGYTDEAIVHHGVLAAGTHFLAKPFTAADLTRKVRQVLDDAPSASVV